MKLEIACFNLDSALIAQENGADRVELCAGIDIGGVTPNFETVKQARENLSIDLYVMIRPRGGNFVYSDEEFQQMQKNILAVKELEVNGFVFGILDENNKIDIERNSELVNLAKPLPCTFHRAFDEVENPFEALEQIIDCGFKTILTSGQAQNVTEGMNRLTELVSKANDRIAIMPGGGLRSTNIEQIQQNTKAVFYHSSAITDGSETANPNEIQALKAKLK
ncbi:copper homeostasis protein CutC [Flavobacterium sp. J49]|uniref:copper homeostasis protein CutC n=1 Tax=Flavobacterium sp. J49 TaxID=2718534 RepID=UPI00159495F7|nr:copper homeostasis protein CutC [Flavobacterium sp. J49]MBF6641882.1 copper homeostasis protein CutC [Flavobacterium sp. J49]NIC03129.1 copper homeostasis protein CutC [Flavobacterium sp. J49]